jgi:hypothetical protein
MDDRPLVVQYAITKRAETLLREYLRRESFYYAVHTHGAAPEWAGELLLGVRKNRAYAVLAEIRDGEYPWQWFVRHVLEGMCKGTVGRGRGTERSRTADTFFSVLAGGHQGFGKLRDMFRGSDHIDLAALRCKMPPYEREALDYLVYSNRLWSERDDP